MDENILDALKAGEYEVTPEGVFFPSENALAQGVFRVSKRGEPEEYSQNLVVTQGRNYILEAALGITAASSNWYIALFTGDVAVSATWTGATFTAAATEWTSYDETTRVLWNKALPVTSGGIDSFSNKSSFTSSSDTQVIRGAALLNASAKSDAGAGSILMASSRLTSDKTLDTGEILDVGYGLQLTAT